MPSITLSGTVTDARAEHVSHGIVTVPTSTPPVEGASIEVEGTVVGHTGVAGAFSFAYPDAGGDAITLTVTAPGFGAYQLNGVTPAQDDDMLAVALTGHAQSMSDQAAPAQAPLSRAGAVTPATATNTGTTAAANCGGYSSETAPPSTIQVLEYSEHTGSGAPVEGTETGVYSVPFETYVEDVLPNEWIASWASASLEAGAMAVKIYGWYWVDNWRGGSYGGTCYNVDDSTGYMRYIPGQSAASTNSAVAATWGTVMTKSGSIFQAGFQATLSGDPSEACGSNLSNYPNTLSQWGSENCATTGYSWKSILSTYYPGISFSGGPGFGSPSANPTIGQAVDNWGTSTPPRLRPAAVRSPAAERGRGHAHPGRGRKGSGRKNHGQKRSQRDRSESVRRSWSGWILL